MKRRAKRDWFAASLLSSSDEDDISMIVDKDYERAADRRGAAIKAPHAPAESIRQYGMGNREF